MLQIAANPSKKLLKNKTFIQKYCNYRLLFMRIEGNATENRKTDLGNLQPLYLKEKVLDLDAIISVSTTELSQLCLKNAILNLSSVIEVALESAKAESLDAWCWLDYSFNYENDPLCVTSRALDVFSSDSQYDSEVGELKEIISQVKHFFKPNLDPFKNLQTMLDGLANESSAQADKFSDELVKCFEEFCQWIIKDIKMQIFWMNNDISLELISEKIISHLPEKEDNKKGKVKSLLISATRALFARQEEWWHSVRNLKEELKEYQDEEYFEWLSKKVESEEEHHSIKVQRREAAYQLALCFHKGRGTKQDLKKAFDWCNKAVQWGHVEARLLWSEWHIKGIGIAKDYRPAKEMLKNMMGKNWISAYYWYGLALEREFRIVENKEALWHYKRAAKYDNIEACLKLGCLYGCEGEYCNIFYWHNFKESFLCFQKAADLGSPEGLFYLGSYYSQGKGCDKDLQKAFTCYRKAAKAGRKRAQYELASLLLWFGTCSEAENDEIKRANHIKEGISWLKWLIVEYYHTDALIELGGMFEEGFSGIQRNKHWAFCLYCKAGEINDNAKAQFQIGFCWENGIGTEKNNTKAEYFYTRSAGKDNPSAQVALGNLYIEEKKLEEAISWFEKAARGHSTEGLFNLVLVYLINSAESLKLSEIERKERICYWCKKSSSKESSSLSNYKLKYLLYLLYLNGWIEGKNDEEANECLQAAKQGIARAGSRKDELYYFFAYVHIEDFFAEKNNCANALPWLAEAAKLAHPIAQYRLGLFYEKGIPGTLEKDFNVAFEWYEKAAKQGQENALAKCVQRSRKIKIGDSSNAFFYEGPSTPAEKTENLIEYYNMLGLSGFRTQ